MMGSSNNLGKLDQNNFHLPSNVTLKLQPDGLFRKMSHSKKNCLKIGRVVHDLVCQLVNLLTLSFLVGLLLVSVALSNVQGLDSVGQPIDVFLLAFLGL
jgi:hypothetical protein